MVKAFALWLWENLPSVNTPLGQTLLNKLNVALDEVDTRVVNFDSTKANQADLLTAVADVTFDEDTGVFSVVKKNGSTKKFDTKLEKLQVNFYYDKVTQQLVITLDDGTIQYVDLKALITELEFTNSNTVLFSVTDGKVSANIAKGSITADMLEPNYLANVQLYASQALSSANTARGYAEDAEASSTEAKTINSNTQTLLDEANDVLEEAKKKVTETTVSVNYETGNLEFESPNYNFTVNESTGNLEMEVA